tara:strand:- start:308 stop:817 length:510 start_codon:yes stop_codon:yes gene_type:complete
MKIDVKYNIDFKKLEKELEQKKLEETLNEGVSDKFAKNSANYIKSGKVKGKISNITIQQRKKHFGVSHSKPLLMTGNLANSLKGSKEGIKSNSAKYGNKSYRKHREGPFVWSDRPKNPDYKKASGSVEVPKREFITAAIDSEKSANNKIYKEFQDKFVKLLSKALRKRR